MGSLASVERWIFETMTWYWEHGFLLGITFVMILFANMAWEIAKRSYFEAALSFILLIVLGMTIPTPKF